MADTTGPYYCSGGVGHPEVAGYPKLIAAFEPGLEPTPLIKEALFSTALIITLLFNNF